MHQSYKAVPAFPNRCVTKVTIRNKFDALGKRWKSFSIINQGARMLFVAELINSDLEVNAFLGKVADALGSDAELIESQVTKDGKQVFAVLEANEIEALRSLLVAAGLELTDLAQVRLVGAELEDIKRLKPKGQYLVEWDFPEGLTMDRYLARKKEKSPLYAGIDDVKFLRTYVREDMVKCLCFYDGESEEAVIRAREIVDTPISRLHQLG
jgi:hypothetical protein